MVSAEENNWLTSVPSIDEVKAVVFDLNGDGAPEHDMFGGHFFQLYWDIIARDVVCSVQDFFYTGF